MGLGIFTTVGEPLWCNCSPVRVLPTWWVWDLILSRLHPFYHLLAPSSLSLDTGFLFFLVDSSGASLAAQSVKDLPAVQEIRVRSLGWEDPLEKEMATHSSILAWKISWTEEPGGLESMGSQRVGHD